MNRLGIEPRFDSKRCNECTRLDIRPRLAEALQNEIVCIDKVDVTHEGDIADFEPLNIIRITPSDHHAIASALAKGSIQARRRLDEAKLAIATEFDEVVVVEIIGGKIQVGLPAPFRRQLLIMQPLNAPARFSGRPGRLFKRVIQS